ncbi:hypothetical protein EIN_429570 [Entamoeba invadens IP1]|uniref:CAAX prenyl protease 2/Lysostaphin resistance protein A-like domain-containing protein n=1 Tax=Entamoeba invadens IP1 TaxID=370355 RepID=A0A0A1UEZ5_ENTIV|nr:hypothetical protein EIN_429570 [Entamoeba invadens IP1]ELP95181.1 hypothetical protein EIN_429570 [Entamoeba invadens IP1]|eukprot:XP_004261952.1 hypothetical protein EIN_429570 [Entamoeba invadens IP1]
MKYYCVETIKELKKTMASERSYITHVQTQEESLPYYQKAKLFVQCGIVCLEFFFLQFVCVLMLRAFGVREYFIQSLAVTTVVIGFMFTRNDNSKEKITVERFIQEITEIKGGSANIKYVVYAFVGYVGLLGLRFLLNTFNIDESPLYDNFYKDDQFDISMVLDSVLFSVITEEIALRRSLFNTTKKYTPQWRNYLYPMSALWFGLIHFVNIGTSSFTNVYVFYQMGYGMVMGYFFAIFTDKLGIFPTLVVHFCNNVTAIFMPFTLSFFLVFYSVISAAILGLISIKLLKIDNNKTD